MRSIAILSVPSLLLLLPVLSASERELSYTHSSEVLAEGQKEIEVWGTFRSGRDYYYRAFDNRLELEYGLGNNVQTAVYLNFSSANSDPSGLGLTTRDTVSGVAWELKWKLTDPVADSFGSALYFEPEVSGHEIGLELKAILDKRIGQDLFALNVTAEPEWEMIPDRSKPEIKTEINIGWSHRVSSTWALGLEFRDAGLIANSDTASGSKWKLEQNVIYAGPTIHATGKGIWGTLTVLPQLFASKVQDGNSNDNRELLGAESVEVRALVGMDF